MIIDGIETVDTGCPLFLQKKALKFAAWMRSQPGLVQPGHKIVELGKMRDKVQLRDMIRWLRAQGRADLSRIASSDKGYWWSDDMAECLEDTEHLMGRARAMIRARNGVRSSFGQVPPEQEQLL